MWEANARLAAAERSRRNRQQRVTPPLPQSTPSQKMERDDDEETDTDEDTDVEKLMQGPCLQALHKTSTDHGMRAILMSILHKPLKRGVHMTAGKWVSTDGSEANASDIKAWVDTWIDEHESRKTYTPDWIEAARRAIQAMPMFHSLILQPSAAPAPVSASAAASISVTTA